MSYKDIWHSEEITEIYRRLKSSSSGLSDAEVAERLKEYGYNELKEEGGPSAISIFLVQLRNPLVYVLIAAMALSLFVSKIIDALVIGIVIILNTLIGFYQEYRAEESLKALKSLASPEAEVTRECPETGVCIETRVKTRELVPGDILLLQAGSRVPADARLIEAVNLETIDSMLTGESLPVSKRVDMLPESIPLADRWNMVYSGTTVAQGRGRAIVVSTGMQTEMGGIAELLGETGKAETPLKRKILDLSNKLGVAALIASGLVFIIGFSRGFDIFELFLFTLATAVSAVPEGLPTVITITLSIGVNRMAKRNAIIRRLQAVETLGSATAICTDKTGTLTTNQMTVRRIFVDGKNIDVTGAGYAPVGSFQVEGKEINVRETSMLSLLKAGVLCNDAKIRRVEVENSYIWDIMGDPTEGAIVVAAQKAGLDKYELDRESPRIDEIPFDSKTKYMATFNREEGDYVSVNLKGAPEVVLRMCSSIEEFGKVREIGEESTRNVLGVNRAMAADALRVLAVASKRITREEVPRIKSEIIAGRSSLTLRGLLGIIDPPRPEVKDAISLCKRAGIRVIMATGDQKLTALAIARELGIVGSDGVVLDGSEIEALDDEALDQVVKDNSAFSRVSPSHKVRIVESLRRQGHIVAMTGDGVNDAPALKSAEIGVAMGISGTDVTKETADMVLADDNFSSIVAAIEEGRVVFENIRKTVKFLISTNTGEIIVILAALLLFPFAPPILLPVQILWINLVTDSVLTIPLALEPKERDVMDRPPRKPSENLINRDIVRLVLWFGFLMTAGALGLYYINLYDPSKAQTMAFAAIATFQIFNSLNCRSSTRSVFTLGLTSNRPLLAAIALITLLQFAAVHLPILNTALKTVPLTALDWAEVFLASSTIFIADEARKWLSKWTTLSKDFMKT